MNLHCHSCSVSTKWNPYFSSRSVLGTQFAPKSQNSSKILFSDKFLKNCTRKSTGHAVIATMAALSSNSKDINRDFGENNDGNLNGNTAKGSGTTARGRRLLKVREDKRKREYDKLHNYPAWAKFVLLFPNVDFVWVVLFCLRNRFECGIFVCRVLEDACKNDSELRAVLGDSIGNPELMRKKVSFVLLKASVNVTLLCFFC